jgi:hypothetical protein
MSEHSTYRFRVRGSTGTVYEVSFSKLDDTLVSSCTCKASFMNRNEPCKHRRAIISGDTSAIISGDVDAIPEIRNWAASGNAWHENSFEKEASQLRKKITQAKNELIQAQARLHDRMQAPEVAAPTRQRAMVILSDLLNIERNSVSLASDKKWVMSEYQKLRTTERDPSKARTELRRLVGKRGRAKDTLIDPKNGAESWHMTVPAAFCQALDITPDGDEHTQGTWFAFSEGDMFHDFPMRPTRTWQIIKARPSTPSRVKIDFAEQTFSENLEREILEITCEPRIPGEVTFAVIESFYMNSKELHQRTVTQDEFVRLLIDGEDSQGLTF